MRSCDDWIEFTRRLQRVYPKCNEQLLLAAGVEE